MKLKCLVSLTEVPLFFWGRGVGQFSASNISIVVKDFSHGSPCTNAFQQSFLCMNFEKDGEWSISMKNIVWCKSRRKIIITWKLLEIANMYWKAMVFLFIVRRPNAQETPSSGNNTATLFIPALWETIRYYKCSQIISNAIVNVVPFKWDVVRQQTARTSKERILSEKPRTRRERFLF